MQGYISAARAWSLRLSILVAAAACSDGPTQAGPKQEIGVQARAEQMKALSDYTISVRDADGVTLALAPARNELRTSLGVTFTLNSDETLMLLNMFTAITGGDQIAALAGIPECYNGSPCAAGTVPPEGHADFRIRHDSTTPATVRRGGRPGVSVRFLGGAAPDRGGQPGAISGASIEPCVELSIAIYDATQRYKTRREKAVAWIVQSARNLVTVGVDGVSVRWPGVSTGADVTKDLVASRTELEVLATMWGYKGCDTRYYGTGWANTSTPYEANLVCTSSKGFISLDGGLIWYPVMITVCEYK